MKLRRALLERDEWAARSQENSRYTVGLEEDWADLNRRVNVALENLEAVKDHAFGTFFEGAIKRAIKALKGELPT